MAFIVDEWLTLYYTVVNVSPHEIFGFPAEGHWDPSLHSRASLYARQIQQTHGVCNQTQTNLFYWIEIQVQLSILMGNKIQTSEKNFLFKNHKQASSHIYGPQDELPFYSQHPSVWSVARWGCQTQKMIRQHNSPRVIILWMENII